MKNEKSDTPRTTNLCARLWKNAGTGLEMIDHAKQLERELNQAIAERDEARKERDYWNVMYQANESCRLRDNAELIKQRDEARECLKEAIAFVAVGNASLVSLQRWRNAAGMETANEP